MGKTTVLLAMIGLAACGGPEREEGRDGEVAEGAFEPLTEQLEKAKAVEDLAGERKREIDDALREVDEPPEEERP